MLPLESAIYKHYLEIIAPELQNTKGDPWKVKFDILLKHYGSFLLDGWGTLYSSDNFIYPGVMDFMAELRKANKNVRLITNSASRSVKQIQDDLHAVGLDFEHREIISSGSLLALLNENIGLKEAYYLGGEGGRSFMEDAKIEIVENPSDPIVILCGIKPTQSEMDKAIKILSNKNSKVLVLNPDVYAPDQNGEKIPVTGSIANTLKEKTGCNLLFCGKPFPLIFEIALRSLIPSTESVVMLGDTLGTDIAGANIAGIDSALVLGRNVKEDELRDDIYELGISPTYILNGF
ncbi:MAG: TIGR01459 family HAD-type hydrolase [Fibromonadaceae bacterium]|jgi:HAD superfamily hydrolase (TIGR01450 family)|nr:TIGR01459 family HAD-type hydrolase [Fibromonadaceae bacterium]